MSRKAWQQRDAKLRLKYLTFEKKANVFRALIVNNRISKKFRQYIHCSGFSSICLKFVNPTRLVNRCVTTGRAGGVFRHFRLTRHQILYAMNKRRLTGVRKSSW